MSERPECNHPTGRYTWTIRSNGSKHYGKQCTTCGKWKSIAKQKIPRQHLATATEMDNQLQADWRKSISDWYKHENERRQAESKKERQDKSAEWWRNYNAYLKTQEWHCLRQKALERDRWTCQACLENPATQVHHRTYQLGFSAPLFLLVAVCEECHARLKTDWEYNKNAGF